MVNYLLLKCPVLLDHYTEVPQQHRKLLGKLKGLSGYFLNFVPEVSILTTADQMGRHIFTPSYSILSMLTLTVCFQKKVYVL